MALHTQRPINFEPSPSLPTPQARTFSRVDPMCTVQDDHEWSALLNVLQRDLLGQVIFREVVLDAGRPRRHPPVSLRAPVLKKISPPAAPDNLLAVDKFVQMSR